MNQNLIRLLGSAFILLAGYFWWAWSVHYLFCFIYLDWIAQEILAHLKGNKIKTSIGASKLKKFTWLSPSLLIISIVLLESYFFRFHLELSFLEEWKAFLLLEDMGVAQGYVLVPLIALSVYMEYKNVFVKQKMYLKQTFSQIWKPHLNMQIGRTSLAIVLLVVSAITPINQIQMLFALLFIPFLWEFSLKKKIQLF